MFLTDGILASKSGRSTTELIRFTRKTHIGEICYCLLSQSGIWKCRNINQKQREIFCLNVEEFLIKNPVFGGNPCLLKFRLSI
jgi:hypothetical protein